MGDKIRTLILNKNEWDICTEGLDRGMEACLYHSSSPSKYPCFIISTLMEEPFSTPWWSHFIVTADTINQDPNILQYMSQEEVRLLEIASRENTGKQVLVSPLREVEILDAIGGLVDGKGDDELVHSSLVDGAISAIDDERKQWNAWWNRIDELKERQDTINSIVSKPDDCASMKFIEEKVSEEEEKEALQGWPNDLGGD